MQLLSNKRRPDHLFRTIWNRPGKKITDFPKTADNITFPASMPWFVGIPIIWCTHGRNTESGCSGCHCRHSNIYARNRKNQILCLIFNNICIYLPSLLAPPHTARLCMCVHMCVSSAQKGISNETLRYMGRSVLGHFSLTEK